MRPVDPDEARRRILEELSREEYRHGDGFVAWVLGLLEQLVDALTRSLPGDSPVPWVLLALAVAAAAVLAVLVLRRTGWLRGAARLSVPTSLDAADGARADELRVRARTALEAGRTDDAVVLALRSLVRDLDERTLLEVSVGMTAHEVAAGAARPFPDLRRRLEQAASAFDTAAYSRRSASPKQAQDAVLLVEYVAQSRPQLEEAAP